MRFELAVDRWRHQPALAWFGSLPERPSLPGFVVMRLIQDAQNTGQVRRALLLMAPLPVVWPTEGDWRRPAARFAQAYDALC